MAHGDWKDMFLAVQNNDIEVVRYYVNQGIDLNYQHPEFMTSPLIECIRCGHLQMMVFLLESGALPDLKEVYTNKTPRQVAKDLKQVEALKILDQFTKK